MYICIIITYIINPLTSPGEGVTVFTYTYLSAGAPALGEAKGLIIFSKKIFAKYNRKRFNNNNSVFLFQKLLFFILNPKRGKMLHLQFQYILDFLRIFHIEFVQKKLSFLFVQKTLVFSSLILKKLFVEKLFNPLTSPWEVVSVFTSPYLSAGAPAEGEVKGLIRITFNSINYLSQFM